jgi:hypothetical protein
MGISEGRTSARLIGAVTAAVALYLLILLPVVVILILLRQNTEAALRVSNEARRVEMSCEQNRDNRAALLDWIDFATRPSGIDPATIAQPQLAEKIRDDDRRLGEARDYAHNHLPPITC